jgi:hypothetical protein
MYTNNTTKINMVSKIYAERMDGIEEHPLSQRTHLTHLKVIL